jgi:hypothetical protein
LVSYSARPRALSALLGANKVDPDGSSARHRLSLHRQQALAFTLRERKANEIFSAFTWTAGSDGFDAAVSYTLELDKAGNNFADPVVVGRVNALSLDARARTAKQTTSFSPKACHADEASSIEFRLAAPCEPGCRGGLFCTGFCSYYPLSGHYRLSATAGAIRN